MGEHDQSWWTGERTWLREAEIHVLHHKCIRWCRCPPASGANRLSLYEGIQEGRAQNEIWFSGRINRLWFSNNSLANSRGEEENLEQGGRTWRQFGHTHTGTWKWEVATKAQLPSKLLLNVQKWNNKRRKPVKGEARKGGRWAKLEWSTGTEWHQ